MNFFAKRLRTPDSMSTAGRLALIGGPLVFAGVIAACGSSSSESAPVSTAAPGTTAAATTATTSTSTSSSTSSSTSPATTTEAPIAAVGFKSAIQPILENSCASCHSPSGPGSVHLVLATAADAQENADYISEAIGDRYMPPWPAGDGDVPFHNDKRLSAEQIDAIREWAATGGELDVDPATELVALRPGVEPIERDQVLTGQPYLGSTAIVDDYRCQIYDPKLTDESFLQGFGIEADQTAVVHHALVFVAPAATREAIEKIDADDPAVGWRCGALVGTGGDDDVRQINSWGPGQAPTVLPSDTGIAMQPGDYFVVQIHYHYSKKTNDLPADLTRLVVDFASDEVIAAAGGSLDPISLDLYLGPAEIPCGKQQQGPLCDRDAAAVELNEQFGPEGSLIAFGLLAQCGYAPADFADMTDGTASSSCDLPATPGEIVSVWGHMHEIGETFRMTLNPDTPNEKVLLDIPKWDFDWQLDYSPKEKIVIQPGDTIRVECSWKRSLAESGREPRYIMWSEGTDDEMCYSQIVTRPTKP
jgi:mono/diheme cytochrome c family protein